MGVFHHLVCYDDPVTRDLDGIATYQYHPRLIPYTSSWLRLLEPQLQGERAKAIPR